MFDAGYFRFVFVYFSVYNVDSPSNGNNQVIKVCGLQGGPLFKN